MRYKLATLPTPSSATGAIEGQRGVVTVSTSSTGTLVLGAIDFARRSLSLFPLLGRSVKSAYRKHATCHCQPEHRARPALRLQENEQWCARIRVLRNGAHSRPEFRNFCRVLTASSPTGEFPRPPWRACRPPRPPCPGRRQHRRRGCCRLNPARTVFL